MATLNEIKEKLEGIEDAIVGKWKVKPLWLKILVGVVVVFIVLLLWAMFKKNGTNEELIMLKDQQKQLNELSKQQKEIAEKDRQRDSTLWEDFQRLSAERNKQVSTYKKQSNEKINSINSADFTNDSIRRAFAN